MIAAQPLPPAGSSLAGRPGEPVVPMHIAILHDVVGPDAREDEKDVLVQAAFVRECLERLGHRVSTVEFGMDMAAAMSGLEALGPDLVFNLVESMMRSGRLIGVAPAVLDAAGIRYTGCPSQAVWLTSGKLLSKRMLRAAGLPTPEWFEEHDLPGSGAPPRAVVPGAWIVKSVWEHASVGLDEDSVVTASSTGPLRAALDRLRERVGGEGFVERFIDGREFNLALLGTGPGREPEVLPAAEIEFRDYAPGRPRVVGFNAKWVEDSFAYQHTFRRYEFPPSDAPLLDSMRTLAVACWREFGLRGYARVDFRVDAGASPWILEINANPCIAPDAGFMAAAERAGLTGERVIDRILSDVPGRP